MRQRTFFVDTPTYVRLSDLGEFYSLLSFDMSPEEFEDAMDASRKEQEERVWASDPANMMRFFAYTQELLAGGIRFVGMALVNLSDWIYNL